MADRAHNLTDKELAQMERHLEKIYRRANKEVGETWKAYLDDVAKEIKPLQDAYDAAKKSGDKDAIKKAGKKLAAKQREKTIMDTHYRNLTKQLAEELSKVNETAAEYINGRLPGVYATNYNFTAGVIESGTNQAISFELANKDAIKYLVENVDKNLLPKKILDPTKDIPWNMRMINSEVLQGIIQGESIPKISKRLKNVGIANEESAIRTARTIVTQTENKARYDCAKSAEEKGVIMAKEWIAAGDSRTRDAHRDAWDRYGTRAKAIPLDEAFIVGGEKMMYAGDPAGGAHNVYNCRCSTPHIPIGFTSILPPEKRGKIKVTLT